MSCSIQLLKVFRMTRQDLNRIIQFFHMTSQVNIKSKKKYDIVMLLHIFFCTNSFWLMYYFFELQLKVNLLDCAQLQKKTLSFVFFLIEKKNKAPVLFSSLSFSQAAGKFQPEEIPIFLIIPLSTKLSLGKFKTRQNRLQVMKGQHNTLKSIKNMLQDQFIVLCLLL